MPNGGLIIVWLPKTVWGTTPSSMDDLVCAGAGPSGWDVSRVTAWHSRTGNLGGGGTC